MIITIDGSSGTGKTTIARFVAERLHLPFYDTGAMYRCVAWALLHERVDLSSEHAIRDMIDKLQLETAWIEGEKRYFVGTVDVTSEIRTKKITEVVSAVSAIPYVRQALWKKQREFAEDQGAVFEGRDMGSVVFPDAELKIFLTARPEVRAERRLKELQTKHPEEVKGLGRAEIQQQLLKRDAFDSQRELAPLVKPEGSIEIDTSDLTREEVVSKILDAFSVTQKKWHRKLSPGWLKGKSIGFFYRTILFISWSLFKLCYRTKVYGLEHFYSKAAIIAPNHTSFLDPPVVGVSWPEEVHYLARESLFRNPLFGRFIRALNTHPVQGDASDVGVFKTILGLLAEGKKVVLFPEGGRMDGELGEIKPGIGLLLSRSKTAIIPTYIHGADQIWGRKRKLPKVTGRLICVFGKPLPWKEFNHLERKQAQQAICSRLEESIRALKKWVLDGCIGSPP